MADFNFIKSEGKFWDLISKVFGDLYEPRKQKRLTDVEVERVKSLGKASIENEVERMKALNKASNEIEIENQEHNFELFERAQNRFLNNVLQEQINIDNVIDQTQMYLPDEVTDETVDKDWTKRYFDKVKNISDEEVQNKWAQILASEITEPGSFSIKTLNVLENMTKKDIELFSRIGSLSQTGAIFFYDSQKWDSILNITYDELSHIAFLGLIQFNFNTVMNFFIDNLNDTPKLNMKYDNKLYQFKFLTLGKKSIPSIILTQAGKELIKFVNISKTQEYLDICVEEFKRLFPNDTVTFADIEKIENGMVEYKNEIKL